jgi:putative membrane-bound dehydrogenase-like protein
MRISLAFLLALFLASTAAAQREYGFDNTKASGQPYLKPEETVAKFKVPPEFEVKLFAGEPQVTNPVAFTIDEKGRVWVVECFEYPKRTPPGKAPRDRIVILEDTNGDGVCDKRTVFAEGKDFPVPPERKQAGLGAFDLCTGIEVGHGGVFVGAAPYLWFIANKDDKPGKFEILLKGFGSQDTHETLNTFQWGPDGWLYGLHGVFTESKVQSLDGPETRMNAAVWRYHPTRKVFEIFAEGTSNPWGMDWRNTDGQFILACCVIPHLYHMVPGGIYKRQAGASFNPHVYGYLNEICDHTFHKESGWAHAGLLSLDVPHMPERFRNSVIFGSIHGCSIKQNILKPNGSTFTASRGDDFLQSGDKNFRPINMKWGPLGDIYLIDWHDQHPCHQTNPDDWDYEKGRVYRIQLKGTQTKVAENLGRLDPEGLLRAVRSDDPYRYRTALRLLHELPANRKPTVAQVRAAGIDKLPEARKAWVAQAVDALSAKQVQEFTADLPGVKDAPADLLTWYIRLIADSGHATPATVTAFTQIAQRTDAARVRRELASAALRLADTHDVTPLLRALMAHKEDAKDSVIPQLVWLAYEKVLASPARQGGGDVKNPSKQNQPAAAGRSLVADELAWLAEQAPGNEFVRDQIVPRTMRRLVATGQPENLKRCIEFVAKLKDAASREKALDGLVVALAGQVVDAPEGWASLQAEIAKDANPKLVALANKLGVAFRDPVALKRAYEVVRNSRASIAERIEALRQVVLLKHPEAQALVNSFLRNDEELPIRIEAARQLVAFADPRIGAATVRDWKQFPREVRLELINSLASRKEWARSLLQAMANSTIDRTEVTDNDIIRIQAFNDAELNKLVEKAWGRTRPTPKDLAALIDKTRQSLHEAPASFERGRKVFENNCAKCHKFEGVGNEVGPALDGAGRDIEYILTNVLDPNRVIGAPYFVRTVRTEDDSIFQGLLAEEDDKTITLKLEGASFKTIRKATIAEIRVSEKSLMPEGLGYNMTAQDFRDLVRYLMAHPFVTEATVNGEKLAAGVPGLLLLPDTKGSPAVVEATVTATAELKTKLLVGSSADYEVRLNGKVLGVGKGTGKQLRPDQDALDVTLPTGKHTLTVVVKGGGGNGLYIRFLDADRKLRHPDMGAKN